MKAFQSRLFAAIVAISGFALFAPTLARAQSTGQLVGTVHDSMGAVVQGANVVATDVLTDITSKAVTNREGGYSFPLLAVGVYTLEISAPGFRSERIEKLDIHVGASVREDVSLAIGKVVATVSVDASAELLQTESPEVSQLVGAQQVSQLPLNGRDVYDLLKLTAGTETGVAASSPNSPTVYTNSARPTVAGGRAGDTVFRVNGINVNNQNLPSASITPNIDSIQEFRAITQLGSADESGASSVALVTKAGTNRFHGTAYDFVRNNDLDAEPYFQVALPAAPGFKTIGNQLRYNQFGGSIGGPIWKDRTFFFGSVQATRIRTLVQMRQIFPTAAELGGDFSGINPATGATFAPIYDPETQAQFPGNKISPTTRFSSYASKLIALGAVPASNCDACLASGLGFNAVNSAAGPTNDIQYTARIDHHFSQNDSLQGTLLIEPDTYPNTISPIAISQTTFTNHAYEVAVGETHLFTANLLNDFHLGYTRNFSGFQQNVSANGAFPFNNMPFALPSLFPTIGLGFPYANVGNGASADAASEVEDSIDFLDSATWTHGQHQVEAGVEIIRARFFDILYLGALLDYGNNLPVAWGYTGNAFSDFLLGLPEVGITLQGTGATPGVSRFIYSGFAQDEWKVLPRLTVDLGLRYDVQKPWHDVDTGLNRLSTLDTSAASAAVGGRFLLADSANTFVPGVGLVTGSGPALIPGSVVQPSYTDLQPRGGFAFRTADNKTVIRGGGGIYYPVEDANRLAFELLSPPFKYSTEIVNFTNALTGVNGGQPYLDSQMFPAGSALAGNEGDNPSNRDQRIYQWTASVDRQISGGLVFSLDYLGNHGVKLPIALQQNQAQLPNAAQLAALETTPSSDVADAQARSTYPNIPIGYLLVSNIGSSTYNALNAKLEGRFANRLNFSAIYTWSKALDDASSETDSPAYTYNLALNKSYSIYDHPQRFVGSWVYELPFGDTVLHTDNAVLKHVVRGWETTGIVTFEGGPPYSVVTGVDTSFRGGSITYPDLAGPLVHSDIRKTDGIYLTPQSFVAPPFGQLGTVRRNAFHGPGINNFDLAAIKNISLHERLSLQLRGEFFNAFNHGQFALLSPQGLYSEIVAPTSPGALPTLVPVPASDFGRVQQQGNGSRVIQIAAKIVF